MMSKPADDPARKWKFTVLARTNPFEILDDDVLERLAEEVSVKEYPANDYLFRQGDPSHGILYVIASGLAEIVVTNGRGTETVIALKRAYDFLGESVVLSSLRYPASVRAKDALACCAVPKKAVERLMYDYPDFSSFFNALLAERIRMIYEAVAAEQNLRETAAGEADSAFFRRRVSEIMAHPVIACRVDDAVTEASRILVEKNINAIVVLDPDNRPRGILTEKNLVNHLIARQRYPVESCRVEQVMRSDLSEIAPNAFIGQALVAMIRGNTRHLVVMERNEPVGVVSMFDLAKIRSPGNLLLTRDIESQPDIRGLRLVSREIRTILRAMVAENAPVPEIFDVMSELKERMTRRVIQLSEEMMRRDGWGPPPVAYCWLNLGEDARYEQTFAEIQCNALVYGDLDTASDTTLEALTARYFRQFSVHVQNGLAVCGLGWPEEGAEDAWRHTISGWRSLIGEWATNPTAEKRSNFFTLLDIHPVWGEAGLADALREIFFDRFQAFTSHLRAETDAAEDPDTPVQFLGTFDTETDGPHANQMNLKSAAIEPMVHGVRLLAARFRVAEPSTLGRIEHLEKAGELSKAEADRLRAAFETVTAIAIRENLRKIDEGAAPDYYVDPYSLRRRERIALKDALNTSAALQAMVREALAGD